MLLEEHDPGLIGILSGCIFRDSQRPNVNQDQDDETAERLHGPDDSEGSQQISQSRSPAIKHPA
jgi:hypothetical protein